MNWPIRTTVLFIFSLLTLISCDEPTDIGLNTGNETTIGTAFTDTITVKAATVLVNDSIVSFRRSNYLTGRYTNNFFGAVAARSFLEVAITGGVGFEDAANARIDSTVLVLDYNEYYGDTTQNLTINVHKLQQGFREDVTYFTNSTIPNESAIIGSATFKPTPRKSVKKVQTTTTVFQSIPARIRLNNAFGNEILAQSGKTPLSNQTEFLKFLPGIMLTADNNAKALLGFMPTSDSTYFKIYYTAGGKKQQFTFNMGGSNRHFAQLTTDRGGTALSGLQRSGDSVSSRATTNTAYLQESVGIKTKITFPYLSKFKAALGDVAINRAELVIPVKNPAVFVPSPYVLFYETDKRNKILRDSSKPRVVVADGAALNNYDAPATAAFNSTTNTYTLNITSYLQGVLYNRRLSNNRSIQNTGLLISPASSSQISGTDALALQSLRQTLLSMEPGNRIQLRIYYSTLKQ